MSHYLRPSYTQYQQLLEQDWRNPCLNTRSSVTCFSIADDTMQPCAVQPIKADGNCFFRALCFYLTGSQAQHSILRNAIVNRMTLVCTESIENYLTAEISTYVEETRVATEVEILGAASLFGVDIAVFSKRGGILSGYDIQRPLTSMEKLNIDVTGITKCWRAFRISDQMHKRYLVNWLQYKHLLLEWYNPLGWANVSWKFVESGNFSGD